ncbi:hypothetical protein D3C87_2145440 [compost metagenome]
MSNLPATGSGLAIEKPMRVAARLVQDTQNSEAVGDLDEGHDDLLAQSAAANNRKAPVIRSYM